uniref:Uncharacterized protein n=1 Tax=Phakopsora pachyrhizi TaxID=170000 RepID=A0A0S1MJ42_PHAPC
MINPSSPIRSLPFSISQPDGISIDTIGLLVSFKYLIVDSNGTLIGGLNENPKIESTITSDASTNSLNPSPGSSKPLTIGILKFSHCFNRFL